MSAKIIEFYVPRRHIRSTKEVLPSRRGRLLHFPKQKHETPTEFLARMKQYINPEK